MEQLWELFNISNHIINAMSVVVDKVHVQEYITVTDMMGLIAKKLSDLLPLLLAQKEFFQNEGLVVDTDKFLVMLQQMLQAQEQEDYVLYSDLLDMNFLPWIKAYKQVLQKELLPRQKESILKDNMKFLKEKDLELYNQLASSRANGSVKDPDKEYVMEPAVVRGLTLKIVKNNKAIYLHSKNDSVYEAQRFADAYYDAEKDGYVIAGLGYVYHVDFLHMKNRDMNMVVFEHDIQVIENAFANRTANGWSWYFENDNVKIIYDRDYSKMKQFLSAHSDYTLVVHRPSLKNIDNIDIRTWLEGIAVRDNNIRLYKDIFTVNSRTNIRLCEGYVDELEGAFQGKQIIIVAAGPSLDRNYHLLKKQSDNRIILAVGAAYKKLMDSGITPDYVIISDAKDITKKQIEGLEEQTISMLLLSTATKEIAKCYKGKKYLICQRGYDKAEEYAVKQGLRLYNTGGSVATIALDIAIQMGAKNIVCIGLDLAYTENKAHAEGAQKLQLAGFEDMIQIPSIDGGMIATSPAFNMARKWIENRIKKEDVTMPVYNATEGGALINGFINLRLQDVLE